MMSLPLSPFFAALDRGCGSHADNRFSRRPDGGFAAVEQNLAVLPVQRFPRGPRDHLAESAA